MTSAQTIRTSPLPGIPDARVIEVASLPTSLAGAVRLGPGLEARPGSVLISVPQIARYLVSNGVAIEVAAMPRADPSAVELFIDTAARAALIHERGELPLISTTVVSPRGKCVVLCGGTGVGKSAVAAALSLRGWLLLAEGVTRMTIEGETVTAQPSHDAIRLWHDTCEFLKIQTADLRPTRSGFQKYYVPVGSSEAASRVDAIIRLRPDPKLFGAAPEVEDRKLLEAHTYKHALVGALGKTDAFERIAVDLMRQCKCTVLEGAHALSLDALADQVEEVAQ